MPYVVMTLVGLIVIAFCAGWGLGYKDGKLFTDYWYGQSCYYLSLLLDPDGDGLTLQEPEPPSPEPLKAMAAGMGKV